ncbi:MAG: hypothetical protein AB1405_10960 [Bdellovibrionota bacterium]
MNLTPIKGHLPQFLLGALVLFFLATGLGARGIFEASLQEDAWAEWGTFFAFLGAGFFFVNALSETFGKDGRLQGEARGPANRAGLLLLALFCLAVAGEEISWGQRVFGFVPPKAFLELNFQQELNFHNFLKSLAVDTRWLVALIALGYGAIAPGCSSERSPLPERLRAWARPLAAPKSLRPWCVAVALVSVANPALLTVEAAELFLGLLLLLDAFGRTSETPPKPLAQGTALLAALLLGLAAAPAFDRFVYGGDEKAVAQAKEELKFLENDLSRGGLNPVLFTIGSPLDKRLLNAIRGNLVRLARPGLFLGEEPSPDDHSPEAAKARTRRGYLLDPWNNSYWIFYKPGEKGFLLYSLGPNRRRETITKALSSEKLRSADLAGDDLGLWVGFPQK